MNKILRRLRNLSDVERITIYQNDNEQRTNCAQGISGWIPKKHSLCKYWLGNTARLMELSKTLGI